MAARPHRGSAVRLRAMLASDAAAVLAVYQAGLDTGQASFETRAPHWDTFAAAKLADHRHVAVDPQDRVLGWVAASRVPDRAVYSGVVEHSVYVHPAARGRGVGLALLQALIASTEAAGALTSIWLFFSSAAIWESDSSGSSARRLASSR